MKEILAEQIIELISCPYEIIGELPNSPLYPRPINNSEKNSFSFVDKHRNDSINLIRDSSSVLIICSKEASLECANIKSSTFIVLEEPKIEFAKIINNFYSKEIHNGKNYEIHKSAVIHPDAKISSLSHIGPNTYVGNSIIEEGTILHGNIYIYDNVKIGKNVIIHAGTTIGAEGFGFIKDNNSIINFPHIGGVVIEDNVEIGSNTCIDRGCLSNTIIGKNTKIDNLVHIAHNVIIEENSFIVANAMIGGSTKIKKNTYIAPSASIRDVITIGENSLIGMGSVVTKDVPSNSTWTGSPARDLKEFLAVQKKLKIIANN